MQWFFFYFYSSNGLKYHRKKRGGHCQGDASEVAAKASPAQEEPISTQGQVKTGIVRL